MQVRQLLTRTAGALGVTAGLLFVGSPLMAQVKIGDNPNSINASSILELESASKGLLLPRVPLVSLEDASPLSAHVEGMHVYNTANANDLTPGEYYNNGSRWVRLVTEVPESLQTFGSNAPQGGCATTGTMYTDTLETSATVGRQWTCTGGNWVAYKSPASTPFWIKGSTTDAGATKYTSITRPGQLFVQGTAGKSAILPSGIIQLTRPTSAQNVYGGSIDFSNLANQSWLYRIGVRSDLGTNGALAFQWGAVSRMLITHDGMIGVATDTPKRPLHVTGSIISGAAGADGVGYATGASSTSGTLITYDIANDQSQISNQNSGDAPNLYLMKNGMGANALFVRFGSTTIPNLGAIVRNGSNVSFGATSDRRLKENIKSTRYTVDDLMKIDVVDYNYKSDETKTPTTGFIAQDLFKVYPDAVIKGGDDVKKNPWMVDYSKVTPLLVKAIQDQQKEIAALKAQLSEMNALKAEVASIKAMLGNTEQQKSEATISK